MEGNIYNFLMSAFHVLPPALSFVIAIIGVFGFIGVLTFKKESYQSMSVMVFLLGQFAFGNILAQVVLA